MRPRKIALAAAVLAASALALSACAPSAPPAASTATAGSQTLSVATTTDVVNYNPLVGNSRSDYWITNLMYPHLLSIANDGSKEPQVATKWGYVDDTTGFYEIRDDLKWSDGEPLTAEDVAWTMNAVKKDKPSGTFYGQLTNLDTAKAVSKTRVEFTLTKPDSSIVEEIGFWGNIVPKHVFEKAESVATFPNDGSDGGWVSAGPYKLTKVQIGQSYTLERVEDYPLVEGGTPLSASVVYRVFPDINTEILALQSGEVDVIANALPPAQVAKLKATSGIAVEEAVGLGYAHMTYNMNNPDLAKVEVRQALAHAVDYDAIRKVVLQGQAVSTGSSPLMPVLKDYYDKSIKEYAFDTDESRKLMEKAGYTAGSDGMFPLKFRLIYSLQDSVTSQWATLVKDSAAKAGIAIELQGTERNTYLAMTNKGDFDIYAGNFAIMDDPVTNMTLAYLPGGAINYTYVDDAKLNDLIAQGTATTDKDDKVKLMREAAKIVRDNVYDNIMYTQNLYFAHSSKWTGFVSKPSELLSIVNPVSLASAHPAGK
ncbi:MULTISPECIES: ABC transporter substrate-binding protein [Leifsonia]|uniref:ABC transporter, substrate-binding protein, family 5 n=3 Tax=Leifsonia TaxID=110932 RepID=U2TBH3_LEIAQ|nr:MULTISPECIES: ABC transporter substrate-binding protein [Leifsonia]ERK72037.1 ABC transporter, substrate-binding protein, family 5 [Leifsonia aquatica ATCC 14665]MBB2965328.1 peptide/nickel transport system substrate-binding protein [Leifsonia aquatica]NYK08861.1 peptide/nickel transport system substrate-binding protein [Leifsonia naganoensis]